MEQHQCLKFNPQKYNKWRQARPETIQPNITMSKGGWETRKCFMQVKTHNTIIFIPRKVD